MCYSIRIRESKHGHTSNHVMIRRFLRSAEPYLDEDGFDLIILDVDLNAFGASPVGRIGIFNDTAPIVVISEFATSDDGIGNALAQGASCVMPKAQLQGHKFVQMLDRYLG